MMALMLPKLCGVKRLAVPRFGKKAFDVSQHV